MKVTPIFGTATVTTHATAVQMAAGYNAANTNDKQILCRKIIIIPDASNTGKIKLGTKAAQPVTLSAGVPYPIDFPEYNGEIDLLDFWVDASVDAQTVNFIAFRA